MTSISARRDKSRSYWDKLKARGLCFKCKRGVKETNPKTGILYTLCLDCRRKK